MALAQDTLMNKYGDPKPSGKYLSTYCMIWQIKKDFSWFPAKEFEVNKDFKTKLALAFSKIELANLEQEIKTFDGCYCYRQSRTTKLLSLHSWAAAIDLNARIEPLGRIKTNWSKEFINIMIESGLFWGGNFHHTKDNMHFALVNG